MIGRLQFQPIWCVFRLGQAQKSLHNRSANRHFKYEYSEMLDWNIITHWLKINWMRGRWEESKKKEREEKGCLRQLFCQSSSVERRKSIQQPQDSISPSFLFFFSSMLSCVACFGSNRLLQLWLCLPLAYPLACSSLYTHKHAHIYTHALPSSGTCHIRLATQLLYIDINLSDLLPASLQ